MAVPYRNHNLQSEQSSPELAAVRHRVGARPWLSLAAALIAAGALASPASAAVRSGNTITVFPDRDMVAAEGRYSGEVTVEIRRNGVLIGRTSGPAQSVSGGSGLEVNHGPA